MTYPTCHSLRIQKPPNSLPSSFERGSLLAGVLWRYAWRVWRVPDVRGEILPDPVSPCPRSGGGRPAVGRSQAAVKRFEWAPGESWNQQMRTRGYHCTDANALI